MPPGASLDASPSAPSVTVEHVTVEREGVRALDDISIRADPGTVVAVIGPNGAGKSTLFGVLSGRLRPASGSVDTVGSVADVLQATAVDPQLQLTVEEVVRMGRYPTLGPLRRFTACDRRTVDHAIGRLDLEPLRRRTINTLSGGQRQRVLVAQGIAQDAPVLLLDEPATGLDRRSQRTILDEMRRQADRGRTVLFSTHQLDDVEHADLVVVLAQRCVCCAPPREAMHDPEVLELFVRRPLQAAIPSPRSSAPGPTTTTSPHGHRR